MGNPIAIQLLFGATPTWDVSLYKFAKITAAGNTAITLEGEGIPDGGVLFFKQDATGSRALSINGTNITVKTAAHSVTWIDWGFDGENYEYVSRLNNATSGSTLPQLTAPANFTATPISITEIGLTWTDGTGETSYEIDYSLDGGATWAVLTTKAAGATAHNHTGLSNGQTVHYRIVAIGDGTTSANSPYSYANATAAAGSSIPGLQAAWNFDEVNNGATPVNAQDATTNGYHLTSVGLTNRTTGKIGNRADSSASTGYFKSATLQNNRSTFSINMWFILGADGNIQMLATRSDEAANKIEWNLHVGGGALKCFLSGDGTNVVYATLAPSVTSATWYMATMVFDNGTLSTYFNGVLAESKACGFAQLAQFPSNEFRIGADMAGQHNADIGVDATRVYSTALTAQEVTELYNTGTGVQV